MKILYLDMQTENLQERKIMGGLAEPTYQILELLKIGDRPPLHKKEKNNFLADRSQGSCYIWLESRDERSPILLELSDPH